MKKKIVITLIAVLAVIYITWLYLSRSELIDVNGYKLETVIRGKSGPSIIFESSFTGGKNLWLVTQYRVSGHARTLVYERAGIGRSDPRPEPRTADRIAIELRALIQKNGLPPPYILVGHSAGCMYLKVFSSMYPDLVGGLVFIDPAMSDFYERWQSLEKNGWNGIEKSLKEKGVDQGVFGQLHALPQTMAEAKIAKLPNVPVTIISATRPSITPLKTEEDMRFWLESHKKFASSIPSSRHVILDNRNHISVLFDHRIADEILKVADQVQ